VFRAGGKELLRYQAEPGELPRPDIPEAYRRGGYFHSLTTLGGRAVADDFPPDHLHHHAVWMAWTKTSFDGRAPDFWNMGQKKGLVAWEALDDVGSESGVAALAARHRYVDQLADPPVTALHEAWETEVRVL